MRNKIYIINGPNLNFLGTREPNKYGRFTIKDLEKRCEVACEKNGLDFVFFQSNHEGEIVEKIQEAIGNVKVIIINAAAFTHTSIAIFDALSMFDGLIIEIHMTNIHSRENFRHNSYISKIAKGIIVGFGIQSYIIAINSINELLDIK